MNLDIPVRRFLPVLSKLLAAMTAGAFISLIVAIYYHEPWRVLLTIKYVKMFHPNIPALPSDNIAIYIKAMFTSERFWRRALNIIMYMFLYTSVVLCASCAAVVIKRKSLWVWLSVIVAVLVLYSVTEHAFVEYLKNINAWDYLLVELFCWTAGILLAASGSFIYRKYAEV